MAEEAKKQLTWQQKLAQGIKLNELEEVKADADFNHKRRERERKEEENYKALKRNEATPSQAIQFDEKKGK